MKVIKKNGRKVIVSLLNRIIVHGHRCSDNELREIQSICEKFNSEKIYNKWILNRKDVIYLDNYFKRKIFFLVRKVYSYLKSFIK